MRQMAASSPDPPRRRYTKQMVSSWMLGVPIGIAAAALDCALVLKQRALQISVSEQAVIVYGDLFTDPMRLPFARIDHLQWRHELYEGNWASGLYPSALDDPDKAPHLSREQTLLYPLTSIGVWSPIFGSADKDPTPPVEPFEPLCAYLAEKIGSTCAPPLNLGHFTFD